MIVIPISGKAGHGKDTIAGFIKEELEKRGKTVLITHYGDLLKYICKQFFGWDGQKDEAGRSMLQYVGTDVIRKQEPDYWVDFIIHFLRLFNGEWDYVLIPDARFPNEVYKIRDKFPSIHLRIIRPGFSMLTEEQQKHKSETALDNVTPDMWASNAGTLDTLRESVVCICDRIENFFIY